MPGETRAFYVRVLETLEQADVPVLVGGAFALKHYTDIERYTKDFDLFVRPQDLERGLAALAAGGCQTETTFTHWLAKAWCGEDFVDVIFGSGNAVCGVDDGWFAHAPVGHVFDRPLRLVPAEELIWSKAFIMERERFDGADVAHVLRARGRGLDWDRLLARFAELWRVLYAHLVLFGFIYPGERDVIPAWVMEELARRLAAEQAQPPVDERLCRGTLLSRVQYRPDIERWGYVDARVRPAGCMSASEAERWTVAADDEPGAGRTR